MAPAGPRSGPGFSRLAVVLRTMREENAGQTLSGIRGGSIAKCILPWVPLMHGAAEVSMMEEWKELASAEPSPQLRATYGRLALVFADVTGTVDEWRRALEGWNMRESQIVLEWK